MESKCYEWGKVWYNSREEWHRENDLPAIEYDNAYKAWCINGKLHREIGPAIIHLSGAEEWFLNDIEYYPEEMPINLYINYLKWEYRKKNGI